MAYAPSTIPLAVPYTHLQTPIAVRTTTKARPPFGAEMYRPNLFVANCRRLAGGRIALGTSDILIIWPVGILFALISSGSGALHGEQAAAARYGAGIAILNAAETAMGNPLSLPPKDLWHCEKLRLQRHQQSFRMLKGKSVDVSTAVESSHFLRPRRAQATLGSSSEFCFRHCRRRASCDLCRQRAHQPMAAAFEPASNRQSSERE